MRRFSMIVCSLPLFASLALAGCSSAGGGAAARPAAAVPAPAVQADDSRAQLRQTCVAMFERARTCTDDYLAMLVDVRVRLDHPAGIAAADRDQGRAALLAQAHEEWASDSTDASIAAVCDQVAQAPMEDAQVEDTRRAVEGCLTEVSCDGFARCMTPITEHMVGARQAAGQAH